MRYLRVEEFKEVMDLNLLARLTDDNPAHAVNRKVVDDTKIQAAILWAEAYVDAQLAPRFIVPLDLTQIESEKTHRLIKESVLEMTVYRLYTRVEQQEIVKEKRQSADTRLARIVSGKMELIGAQERPRRPIHYRAPRR